MRRRLALASLALALVLATAAPLAAALATTAVFDEVWRTVKEHFYDPELRGVDWEAARARYRPLVAAAPSAAERAAIINRMLGELGASHTGYFVPDEPAYYELLDVFVFSFRHDLRRLFPEGEIEYTGIGVFTRAIGDRIFVTGVLDGLPAERAGLRVGDEIVAAAGRPWAPIDAFAGKRGVPVPVAIRRTANGPVQDVSVVPERIRPGRAFLDAMTKSAHIIEHGGRRIGYVHVWSYAGAQYQARLERELHSGRLKDADALIWDLRDGWGGAQPEYLDMFSGRGPVVEMTDRAGKTTIDNVKFDKPVVMLINGGTRSGKEILAYGFKKYGLGELVGTRTTGAVLAARGFLMSDGSLLELAVADVKVDGQRLEGVGVTPTVEVPFALEYAAGRDPQLERALSILTGSVRRARVRGAPTVAGSDARAVSSAPAS